MAEDMMIGMGLVGGLLIGLGSAVLLYCNGKIAGISGILGGVLGKWGSDSLWRWAFLIGIPLGVLLVNGVRGYTPDLQLQVSTPVLIVAGLLVGFGTRLGSGCTSGHGVCGLSRLSPRSLVATLVFMGAGFAAVHVVRHLLPAG